ncbi:hypothetical protein Tco_0778097 [Tanacetum coccineum]
MLHLPSCTCGFVQLKEKLDAETLNLVEEEFVVDGLLSDHNLSEEVKSNHEGVFMAPEIIFLWKEATNKLIDSRDYCGEKDNRTLKDEYEVMRVEYDRMKNVNRFHVLMFVDDSFLHIVIHAKIATHEIEP